MKDIIVTIALILLGVFIFMLILGYGENGGLLGATDGFFKNMLENFGKISSKGV